MRVAVLFVYVIGSSSALLLGTPRRGQPQVGRSRCLVAAEGGDDLLDSFRKTAAGEQALEPAAPSRGLVDELDDDFVVEEPSIEELVATMPGFEKAVIASAAAGLFVFVILLVVL